MFTEISRTKAQPVTFALPIAKVDAETRTVKGIASQECVDAHGQIVDYPTLKACLPGYKNNIREMHQPKAVGKAIALECDDTAKALIVESYISKGAEDTWTKVQEGILTSYSIGGIGDIVIGKNADGKTESRIFLSALNEISLVDVPACPTATFEIVKLVDGQPTDVSPGDPDLADTAVVTKAAAIRKRLWEGYDIERALAVLALLQSIVDSEIGDLIYGDEGAGDPEAAAQVDTLRLCAELMFDFVMSEFASQFTALDARMAAIGKLAGPVGEALTKALADPNVTKALRKIDKSLAQKMHDNCVNLGAACGAPMEKTIDTPAATPAAPETPAAAPVAETTTEVPPVVEKVEAVATAVQSNEQIANVVKAAIAEATAPLVTQLEEQKATLSANAETIAKLGERLKTVEDSPAPGGPVKQAVPADGVQKTLAADGSTANPQDVGALVNALATELAPNLSPEERGKAAMKVLTLQQQTGFGRTTYSPSRT